MILSQLGKAFLGSQTTYRTPIRKKWMLPAIRTGARLYRGVLFLITMGFAIHVLHAPAVAAGPCAVLPFNNLGMHCMDNDFSQLSILPPFNVLNVFVIQTGPVPQVMKSADVNVFFQAIEDPNGSINTSSVSPFLKTNFWKYVSGLFGVSLRPDFGLTGVPMPGPANTPRQLTFIPAMGWFSAQGIPITDRDDSGRFNPYPMMRAFARNKEHPCRGRIDTCNHSDFNRIHLPGLP